MPKGKRRLVQKKPPTECRTCSMSYYVTWFLNSFLSYLGLEKKTLSLLLFSVTLSLLQKGVPMDAHKQGELALVTSPSKFWRQYASIILNQGIPETEIQNHPFIVIVHGENGVLLYRKKTTAPYPPPF